jgi:hypothetical protein
LKQGKPSGIGWVRASYDKLAVLVVLVLLMTSALFLLLEVRKSSRMVANSPTGAGPKEMKAVEPLDTDSFNAALSRLNSPPMFGAFGNTLMVSEKRVWCTNPEGRHAPIPYDTQICPYCQFPQPEILKWEDRDDDVDDLPNGYERDHDLDPNNPADASFDSDGDGFTSLEEFKAGTDPTNEEDYPDLPSKLRLVGVRRIPFVLRFQGVNDMPGGGKKFLLNLRSLDRSYFASLGETVEGFTLVAYDPDARGGASLTLEKRGEQTTLTKGVSQDRVEVVAGLVFLLDGSTFRLRVGETFDLRGVRYIVVDIRRNIVSIRNDSGSVYSVQPLTSRERDELTGSQSEAPRVRDEPAAGPFPPTPGDRR